MDKNMTAVEIVAYYNNFDIKAEKRLKSVNGWINYLLAFFHRLLVIGIVLSGELAYSFDIKIIMHCYMLEIKMQSVHSGIIFFYFSRFVPL